MATSLVSARLRVALVSGVFSVCYSAICAVWPGSDGRTAVGLGLINLTFFLAYLFSSRDSGFGRLLASAGVFGLVELLADFLCVRFTGTLDYSVARSPLLLVSPWWMPLSWTVVAVQLGAVGAYFIKRLGWLGGALTNGFLGALFIPFYEEMAWGANWWRYRNCLQISHTPVYIIVAEALIGSGLAIWADRILATGSSRKALWLGLAAGLLTIPAGMVGWGLVEFILRGAPLVQKT